jgi:hypothetical protein
MALHGTTRLGTARSTAAGRAAGRPDLPSTSTRKKARGACSSSHDLTAGLVARHVVGAVTVTGPATAGIDRNFVAACRRRNSRTTVDFGPRGRASGPDRLHYAVQEDHVPVGYLLQTCTILEHSAADTLSRCTGELSVSGSTVVFQGLFRSSRTVHRYAVTGGLGQFRSARGELVLDTPLDTATDQIRLVLD